MQARKWKLDTDYKYLVEWWKQYDFGTVPKECLPPDGIVVLLDRPICAAGLYLCKGTKFGFMEWVVVDKKIGLNWYLNPCTRVMFNYVMGTMEDHLGEETTENTFQCRMQIDF